MSHKYNWTVTSNYHYDATLTQSLVNDWISDQKDSSGRDTHMYYITGVWDETWRWPSGSEKKQNTTSHYETETDEPLDPVPVNSTYEIYENFTAITGVDFTTVTSAGLKAPLDIYIGDSTTATGVTFAANALVTAGEKAVLNNITFVSGGSVLLGHSYHDEEEYVVEHTDMGDVVGTRTVYFPTLKASLTNLSAAEDFGTLVTINGGSAFVNGVTVERNMRNLFVAGGSDGYYNVPDTKRFTGSGTVVSNVTVHGVLSSAYVANGAVLEMLTVGNYRQWGADSHASAFLGVDVWGSTSHLSAVRMTVASGGTANNIFLGFGGSVTVEGPEDKVTSQWVSSGGSSYWEVTTQYAAGNGGSLTNLQMATHGGLMFEGGGSDLAQKLWSKPYNYDLESSKTYKSGFIASAPQSSYVSFGSNASGRNITIGNGGSLYIGKNASVTGISMGGLLSSLTVVSSGATHVWIGDRGAKLVLSDGGFASDVKLDFVRQSFDYYSAAHDYFWLLSDSLEKEYYSAHGSYGSGEAWSSSIYNSASSGYRQYMSGMYNSSGGVYTNLGDDTNPYARRYVGGEVLVAGGQILNLSGFCYLQAKATVDVTVSNNVSSFSARQWTNGHVSKAVGALSATMEVADGGHVSNVKIEGGRVIMTGGGYVNARWHDQENKQSNYNLVEDLDLRFDDMGLGGDHPAYIEFAGGDSGGFGRYVYSGDTSRYIEQRYDAIDPGEIHSVTANSGLTVWANWNWGKQDFTYIGGGSTTINGLGTVVLKDNHSRYTSDSWSGKGPYLGSAFDTYYFGVVKGVYNEEDGTLENRTILDGENGGFDWKGYLTVGSGGIVQNIGSASPLKTGNDIVNSDTWTPSYTRDECKVLTVVAGGSADNVTVKGAVSNFEHFESQYTENRAGLLVSSNGIATNVTILEGGIAMAKGGTIDKVFVGAGGILYLSGWAGAHQVAVDDYGSQLAGPQYLDTTVLNAVRLDSGGQLANTLDWGFRKGNAPSVIANKGGGILNGVTANGVAYVSGLDFAGTITLTNGQQAIDVTVRGFNKITSRDDQGNPTAYTTTVASLNVSSGGIVNGATVGDEGAIYVSTGASVKNLTASGGRIIFANSSGWSDYFAGSATVSGIAVLAGGVLEVNSKFGLKTSGMQIGENAGLTFTLGDTASEDYTPTELNGTWTAAWGNGSFYTDDGTMSGFGGQFGQEYKDLFYSSSYVSARLSMTVAKGGTLTGADLRGYGSVLVTSGGKVLGTKIKGITANIGTSGYASGLYATTESTGSAYDTNIYVYGSGAVADKTTLSGGFLGVERGGVANGVAMFAPEGYTGPFGNQTEVGPAELEIAAGGTAKDVIASAGVITMYEGSKDPGTASPKLSNADVHYSATLLVNCNGAVLDGTLNLGGLVTTTATRYEYVEVQVTDPATGNTYTDWQRVEKNNAVAVANTLTVNFDLTERDGSDEDAMIDNLANLAGAKLGTITVSADQAEGTYVLAQGAADFTGSVTVKRGTENLGAFTVGTYYQYDEDTMYSLTNDDETGLCFTIQSTGAAVSKIVATVDGRELLAGQWANKSVTIKAQGNKSTKSLWYRIHKAVITRGGAKNGDEWLELDGENGVTISEFCDIEIRAKDAKGNYSKSTTYRINYDATPAEISDFRSDTGGTNLAPGTEAQVSVLVSDDLDDAPTLKLLTGNDEWTDVVRGADDRYAFTVTRNGKYTLRAVDHAGNVTTSVVTVDFYETSIEPPTVKASTTKPTNKNITITATFSKDSAKKQYSTDNKTWQNYTAALTATKNGTWYFRATDAVGNQSVTTFKVTNIDKTAPAAPTLKASTTKATNQNVTITAAYSSDSVKKQYSTDNKSWKDCADTVSVGKNGTYYFRSADAAGNVSKVASIKVANIDKTAPAAPTVKSSNTKVTNKNITITATFSKDSSKKQYSTDNKTWSNYSKALSVGKNGTYYFRGVDAAGNASKVTSIKVANIDKEAPAAPTVKASKTAFTNKNVTITATFSKDSAKKQYSTDKKTWQTYSKSLAATKNGTWYFRGVDAAGNVSAVTTIKVANIDKTAPVAPAVKSSNTKLTNKNITITATFSKDSAKKQYSTDNKTWKNYTEAVSVGKNGTYYFRGIDAAGNVSKVVSIKVANIDKTAPAAPTVKVNTANAAKSVTITATFSKDSAKKQYSTDKKTWKNYSKAISVNANGTYYFRGIDAAGNQSKVNSVKVANIVDTNNNKWTGATELTGTVLAALDKKADPVDYYDVGDVAQLMVDMNKGETAITFYDGDKKAVAVTELTMADGSVMGNVSSLTLATGNATRDHFTIAALDDAVKYLKIETAGSNVAYQISKLA